MSSDITTNQLPKDSQSVSRSAATQVQNRQNVAVQAGNTLPPEMSAATSVSSEELQQVVAELNQHVQQIQRDLQFSVDESSGHTVVRVLNSETQEVVRQMPSEEALRISRNIKDNLDEVSGLIFETSA